ncbi:MAG: RluA family pseudouridine synthase [Defluviitaleaceae bacterium]|nr:RluA family pseudouridine synthase [Defluviitaleaceae bacterium]
MITTKLVVTEEQVGARLDAWISVQMPELSRTRATEFIRDGFVLVNGQIKKAKYKPQAGEEIEISVPEAVSLELIAEDLKLDIVYEDSSVVVVNKPSGMVVHPAPGHGSGTLVNGLMYAIKDLSGIKGHLRPGIVHRIDKDTTGLLMVAKHDQAHEALSQQLKEKRVKREYLALVHGVIDHDLGKIDAPIGRDPKDRIRYAVVEGGKASVTHFEVLKRFNDYTFIKCRLETGRTHQIRVHMRYIGHGLVGDPLYGPRKTQLSDFGQFLHATSLGFEHPETHAFLAFEAELPGEFTRFLNTLE